jgi:hypothetical protein
MATMRASISFLLGLSLLPARARGEEPDDEEPPLESRLVLRYKQLELRPDLKLYADWQIAPTTGDNAFHLTRAYLGLKLQLASWLSGRVTVDISQASDLERADGSVSKLDGSYLARLKYGYLEAKLEKASLKLAAGMIHTPYIYWVEHIEGTRFLRKVTLEEEYGYPSADLGLAVFGHVRDHVDYALGVYNGGGYHALELDREKDLIGRLSIRPLPAHRLLAALQLTGYGHLELRAWDSSTRWRAGGALTWRLVERVLSHDCRNVAGERLALFVQAFASRERDATGATRRTVSVSGGARVELPAHLSLIGRVDWHDRDLALTDTGYWRVLGAVALALHEGVRVALAYQGKHPSQAGVREQLLGAHLELGL